MKRIRFLASSLGAVVDVAPLAWHVLLTRRPAAATITVSSGLAPERQLMAAATMLEVLVAGWPGSHTHLFNVVGESHETWISWLGERKAYRAVERAARRRLMPAAWMERQAREGVDPRASAADAGVPFFDYFLRTMEWQEDRRPKRPEPDVLTMLADGTIKRAADLPPRPRPAPARPVPNLRVLPPLPPQSAPKRQPPAGIILPAAPKLPPPPDPTPEDREFMSVDPKTGLRKYALAAHIDLPLPKPAAQFRTTHGWLMKTHQQHQDAPPPGADDAGSDPYEGAIPF